MGKSRDRDHFFWGISTTFFPGGGWGAKEVRFPNPKDVWNFPKTHPFWQDRASVAIISCSGICSCFCLPMHLCLFQTLTALPTNWAGKETKMGTSWTSVTCFQKKISEWQNPNQFPIIVINWSKIRGCLAWWGSFSIEYSNPEEIFFRMEFNEWVRPIRKCFCSNEKRVPCTKKWPIPNPYSKYVVWSKINCFVGGSLQCIFVCSKYSSCTNWY